MFTDPTTHGATALAEAVRAAYRAGQTDYALEPLVAVDAAGAPVGRIAEGDAVVFCCRRGEREIQLTEAFTEPGFDRFPRPQLRKLTFVPLTLYHEKFKDLPVAFAPSRIPDTLGEIVSRAGLRQLRVAESEKYAHVTFFFNGGTSQPFAGEDDLRIPSPIGISYEQVPEMSLAQVAAEVVHGIEQGYDLIVTNFANGDVIGHTANREAKLACAGFVDARLGQVVDAALAADIVVLITADHGNLEEMTNPDGTPHVAHTTNLVPFIAIDPRAPAPVRVRGGKLADVAPTVLHAFGIPQSATWHGVSLAPEHAWGGPRRVLLIILDGWGLGRADDTNPIFLARTPAWDALVQRYGMAQLRAAGEAVGLGADKAGNSEAGHMNIGAGRVVLQDDVRLDLAMQDGSFATNEVLLRTILDVKRRGASLHLIGLLTERSSHGSIDYPLALLRMAAAASIDRAYVHIIFDGRSTEPGSAPALLEELERQVAEIGVGQIVSGVGRGIALDRNGNYAKTRSAYEAFVDGAGTAYAMGSERHA
jgi:2,3-bisphosphoglycerate-independent phosphoglycerate mutase